MAKLVFGMNMSLDGYVDHDHEAFAPDPVLFKYFIEQTCNAAGSIYGRGLYGKIEVGGPKLAASLTKLGLIDEYQLFLHPVVLGRGKPFFVGPRPRLRLMASDRIGNDAIRLMYVPA